MTAHKYDFSDAFEHAVQQPVNGPLQMRTTPAGTLEVLCYREYNGTVVPTVIQFLGEAAGQLVHDLYEGVRRGDIRLEIVTPGPTVQ
jgi:hypothetical protein